MVWLGYSSRVVGIIRVWRTFWLEPGVEVYARDEWDQQQRENAHPRKVRNSTANSARPYTVTHSQIDTHIHTHTHTHTSVHKLIHTHTRACTRVHTYTYVHTNISQRNTRAHTHIHTQVHTYAGPYSHAHTHSLSLSLSIGQLNQVNANGGAACTTQQLNILVEGFVVVALLLLWLRGGGMQCSWPFFFSFRKYFCA
jgi:hypothetical protein